MKKNQNYDHISYFAQCCIIPAENHRISTAELYEKFEEFCAVNGFDQFNRISWYQVLSRYHDVKHVRGIKYGNYSDCRGFEGIDFCSQIRDESSTDGMLWLTQEDSKDFFVAFFVVLVIPQVSIKIYSKNELQMAFDRFCLSRHILPFYVQDWSDYLHFYELPNFLTEEELSFEMNLHRSFYFGRNSLSVKPDVVKESFDEGRIISMVF